MVHCGYVTYGVGVHAVRLHLEWRFTMNKPWFWCGFFLGFTVAYFAMMLSGCTSIDYGNFHYRSLGGVSCDRLEAVKDGNDILVDVTMYKKENVGDVAGKVAEGVVRGMK